MKLRALAFNARRVRKGISCMAQTNVGTRCFVTASLCGGGRWCHHLWTACLFSYTSQAGHLHPLKNDGTT
eukprot:1157767-Pelagomonas_calceolata.AAC.7